MCALTNRYFKRRSPPSKLSRVCVGPSLYRDRSNISWDSLSCHLQNGADIIDYTIQYTQLSTGIATNISSSDDNLAECHQDSGGCYPCVPAGPSVLTFGQTYSFQVAARNIHGVGSFSTLLIAKYGSQGKYNSCYLLL